jgi:hypothetical protein
MVTVRPRRLYPHGIPFASGYGADTRCYGLIISGIAAGCNQLKGKISRLVIDGSDNSKRISRRSSLGVISYNYLRVGSGKGSRIYKEISNYLPCTELISGMRAAVIQQKPGI